MRSLSVSCAWLMILGSWAGAALSQEWFVSSGLARERVIGLLDLPEVLPAEGCAPHNPESIPLYGTPSKDRAPIGAVETRRSALQPPTRPQDVVCETWDVVVSMPAGSASIGKFPTEESGYEARSAVVYERAGRWFRIALQQGSAWVERADTDGFLSYPDTLTQDRFLTHLRNDWDGRLWRQPGTAANELAPAGWLRHLGRTIPIAVLETRPIGPDTWVRVRLDTEACGVVFENVAPVEGWLPAHRPSGGTTLWFSSRGC